uniref:Uncharacterized protein n=1 Tax=viral metagenome TaxID=1070528 RepID=A0A6C0JVB1_9ZZZZ
MDQATKDRAIEYEFSYKLHEDRAIRYEFSHKLHEEVNRKVDRTATLEEVRKLRKDLKQSKVGQTEE